MDETPDWARAAREQWRWRGQGRPAFAAVPGPGQASVWDYPRPPRVVLDEREVLIRWGGVEVARTRGALRVLETAHPPSFYLPWADVARHLLQPAPGASYCEWKGPASYWTLVGDAAAGATRPGGARRLERVAWSYPQPLAGAEALAGCVAFYPGGALECSVAGAPATAQPGGFYGGWVTPELTGPFKGAPGSEGW